MAADQDLISSFCMRILGKQTCEVEESSCSFYTKHDHGYTFGAGHNEGVFALTALFFDGIKAAQYLSTNTRLKKAH